MMRALLFLLLLTAPVFGQAETETDLGSTNTIESSADQVSVLIGGVEAARFDDDGGVRLKDNGTVPGSGETGFATLIVDPADGEVKVRKSAGDGGGLVSLEAGGGATINIEEEGSAIPNTPHSTLNFVGAEITATDAGSGQANITFSLSTPVSLFEQNAHTATGGQTAFALSTSFVGAGGYSEVLINGIGYEQGTDYTISGTTMTWLDTPFALIAGDRVVIRHQTQ